MNNRMNPFKFSRDENELTDSYLQVLNLSPGLLFQFLELIRSKIHDNADLEKTIIFKEYEVKSQKKNLPKSEYYISVALTKSVSVNLSSEETQVAHVFDGIIKVDDFLTIVIENKPKDDIRNEQLDLSTSIDLSKYKLHPQIIVIEWSEVIESMLYYSSSALSTSVEEKMINYFIDSLVVSWSELNIYSKLSVCTSQYLFKRRIRSLIESILTENEEYIENSWAQSISVNSSKIDRVGIIIATEQGNVLQSITIAGFYGLTLAQSSELFKDENYSSVLHKLDGYSVAHFLEIRAYFTEIIRIYIDENQVDAFVDYFKSKRSEDLFREKRKSDLSSFLEILNEKGIINYTDEIRKVVEFNLINKKYKKYRCSPGIYVEKSITGKKAIKDDNDGSLSSTIRTEVNLLIE